MSAQEKPLYALILSAIALFIVLGIGDQGFSAAVDGFIHLQSQPARLIDDFTLSSVGGALLNSAAVGLIGLSLIWFNNVLLSGPMIAAVFTMMGFGLFGKTPTNVLPIILGVFLAARIVRKKLKAYIIMALFGTALGPLVTYLVFEAGFVGFPSIIVGTTAGILTGVCLPPLALTMLSFHQGYNLYNVGFSCGFFGLFVSAILTALKNDLALTVLWNKEPSLVLMLLVPAVSVLFIAWGLYYGGKKAFLDLLTVQKLAGRLPSDFFILVSPAGALLNIGLIGLAGCTYVYAVGGDFNGPVIGGLLTLLGFGGFGKHMKNCWPVLLGVVAATLVYGKSLVAPGPILAALFGTTLAPLAGQFGPLVGAIAGFLHLSMVEQTAAWHGGMDLYNNGFAGGLTATLIVAIIEWYRSNRS